MRESRRMTEVQTPIIPVVGDWVRSTPGTISLGQGMVYYGPPPQAAAMLSQHAGDPTLFQYQPVEGIAPLVVSLAQKLREENGIEITLGSRIVVTAGGNMAFLNAILAVADVGDEIILQKPYYFNHEMAVRIAGCVPVLVDTDGNYQLRVEAIARAVTPRTRAIVTVSPNNPTGAVYPEASLRAVNELCRAGGVYHIHDEAYEYFTYDDVRPFSPGSLPGSAAFTISLFSLSKAYGFAGWRVGYMTAPEHLFEAIRKIQDTNLICPPVPSQIAAMGALLAGPGYCRGKLRPISDVRQVALRAFRDLESLCDVPRTDGAFYFLIRVKTDLAPLALVERLVKEHKVAVIPGTAFGVEQGCSLRVAYGSLEKSKASEGIGRLVRGLWDILEK